MADKKTKPPAAEVYEGEIVEKDDTPPKATMNEIRFARLIEDGMDPVEAAGKVSKAGKTGIVQPMRQKKAIKKAANQLLKSCQEKMLINVSEIAPRALSKLEELLDAKEPVYYMGRKIGEKESLETQRKTATKLVDMAMPKDDDRAPSLVAQVIQINN